MSRMTSNKTLVSAVLAAACLSLVGCSSGDQTPSSSPGETTTTPANPGDGDGSAPVCVAGEQWLASYDDLGTEMNNLGTAMSATDDPADFPVDQLHASGAALLDAVDSTSDAFATMIALVDDPAVANTLTQLQTMTEDIGRWMGQAAVDSDDILEFSMAILADYDKLDQYGTSIDSLDGDAVDAYFSDHCGIYFGAGF
jgi:hypothetical protein